MPPKHRVICRDGGIPHSVPFATLSHAARWTAEGHNCAPATSRDLVVFGASGKEKATNNHGPQGLRTLTQLNGLLGAELG